MDGQTPFQLSCPGGEQFYACDYGARFLGCCASQGVDICANGCEPAAVRVATFDKEYYSNITHNDCNTTSTTGEWYTCGSTSPPFLGCCASNACADAGGCPSDQLLPAKVSTNDTEKAPFSPILIKEPLVDGPSSPKIRTNAIVGGVVGGVVFALLIGSIVRYCVRKFRRSDMQQPKPVEYNKDLNLMGPPPSSALSPAPTHSGLEDVGAQSVVQELHTESAPVAELASSDAPPPVPKHQAPDPAPTPQIHPTGSIPNVNGFRPDPKDHAPSTRAPRTTFAGPFNDDLATNF